MNKNQEYWSYLTDDMVVHIVPFTTFVAWRDMNNDFGEDVINWTSTSFSADNEEHAQDIANKSYRAYAEKIADNFLKRMEEVK